MWSSTRKDGKYYGIPFTCDPYVLFYREDVFEENQLEVPQTWEELMECGKTIQKMGVKSIGIAGKRETETANVFQLMLYSMGGNFRSISQDTGVEAFDYFWKMARYGMLSKEMMNYTQEDLAREFAEGKISIMINQMSTARKKLDWEEMFSLAIDPEKARRYRAEAKPEKEDTCSMCGNFCAVKNMNRILDGEIVSIFDE